MQIAKEQQPYKAPIIVPLALFNKEAKLEKLHRSLEDCERQTWLLADTTKGQIRRQALMILGKVADAVLACREAERVERINRCE